VDPPSRWVRTRPPRYGPRRAFLSSQPVRPSLCPGPTGSRPFRYHAPRGNSSWEEVRDGPHNHNRGGGSRGGVALATAPLLMPRAGVLRVPASIMPPGRAVGRPSARPFVLRGLVGGATMTVPGGRAHQHETLTLLPRAPCNRFLSQGRGFLITRLRPFALPRSYAAGVLMYAKSIGLTTSYIRNIIPCGM
jgi:hypothetical protein